MRFLSSIDRGVAEKLGWAAGCTCRYTAEAVPYRVVGLGCLVHDASSPPQSYQLDPDFWREAVVGSDEQSANPPSLLASAPPREPEPKPTTRMSVMGEVASGPLRTVAPTDDGRIAFHSAMGFDFRLDQASARALSQCLTTALSQQVAA